MAKFAALEGHIDHGAVVHIEHTNATIFEVDGEKVSISDLDRVRDV